MDRACWATAHGLQSVGHDWVTNTFTIKSIFWYLPKLSSNHSLSLRFVSWWNLQKKLTRNEASSKVIKTVHLGEKRCRQKHLRLGIAYIACLWILGLLYSLIFSTGLDLHLKQKMLKKYLLAERSNPVPGLVLTLSDRLILLGWCPHLLMGACGWVEKWGCTY